MQFPVPSPDSMVLRNPDGGMLCHAVYWRPRITDPDPEMPGEKSSVISFLPVADDASCLCGSGKLFRACCQLKPYWRIICPNPGLLGYDILAPQTATFVDVKGEDLGPKFMDEERLYCLENTFARAFWTYWGDPSLLTSQGTLCFGDFELLNARRLVVTAMSNRRMELLLSLLTELAGDSLGTPQIERESVKNTIHKSRHRKHRMRPRRH